MQTASGSEGEVENEVVIEFGNEVENEVAIEFENEVENDVLANL